MNEKTKRGQKYGGNVKKSPLKFSNIYVIIKTIKKSNGGIS